MATATAKIIQADCIEFLRAQPKGSVDLVFGSPPYEKARLYLESGEDLSISRDTESWVAWMVEVYKAALHCSKGLVAFVVEGQTKDFRYSAGPMLLAADLCRAGITLRKPPIFHRVGIPGSGGPDWLRNDFEFVICATNGGKLPWSDNTAKGESPKFKPGGEMSYRTTDEQRTNLKKEMAKGKTQRQAARDIGLPMRHTTSGIGSNGCVVIPSYVPPEKANPGNVIHCTVGGGRMGESGNFSEESEAPFPESLAEFFILSFCPPGGTVLDPFSGSGTTATVALRHGRNALGCDLRQSQVDLGNKRLEQETPMGLFQ